MIIALVGARFQLFMPVIERMDLDIRLVKNSGTKLFYKINTELSQDEIIEKIKYAIKSEESLKNYTYAIYGIYNGMIDLFPYLSKEMKDSYVYYHQDYKDITQKEIDSI